MKNHEQKQKWSLAELQRKNLRVEIMIQRVREQQLEEPREKVTDWFQHRQILESWSGYGSESKTDSGKHVCSHLGHWTLHNQIAIENLSLQPGPTYLHFSRAVDHLRPPGQSKTSLNQNSINPLNDLLHLRLSLKFLCWWWVCEGGFPKSDSHSRCLSQYWNRRTCGYWWYGYRICFYTRHWKWHQRWPFAALLETAEEPKKKNSGTLFLSLVENHLKQSNVWELSTNWRQSCTSVSKSSSAMLSPTVSIGFSPSGDSAVCPRAEFAVLCCQTHRSDVVGEFYRRAQLQQGYVIGH